MIITPEDVQRRLRVKPFAPLRIVTTTGEIYDIHHADLVLITRRFLEIGMPSADNPTVADLVTRVALVHVTELRNLSNRAPPTNGQ